MLKRLLATQTSMAVILIRLMVGSVFLSEGIQKFVFPGELGVGRFEKIGFANPEFTANFVACFEIACGSLVLLGLLTRLAAVPLVVIIVVAIVRTKIPMLQAQGFWKMAHEARADWSMLLGSLFLCIAGGGSCSVDKCIASCCARKTDGP